MSAIVDVPFRRFSVISPAPSVVGRQSSVLSTSQTMVSAAPMGAPVAAAPERQCQHVRANGRRCRREAEEQGGLCKRHAEWFKCVPPLLAMPYPDDAVGLQETMARAVGLVLAKVLDAPRAQAVASLCRIMRENLADCARELEEQLTADYADGADGRLM